MLGVIISRFVCKIQESAFHLASINQLPSLGYVFSGFQYLHSRIDGSSPSPSFLRFLRSKELELCLFSSNSILNFLIRALFIWIRRLLFYLLIFTDTKHFFLHSHVYLYFLFINSKFSSLLCSQLHLSKDIQVSQC